MNLPPLSEATLGNTRPPNEKRNVMGKQLARETHPGRRANTYQLNETFPKLEKGVRWPRHAGPFHSYLLVTTQ